MKPTEAAKLLGGYAAGILTEAERRVLFAAALDRQELFDALMDEEALRELLSDPAVKAQLIAELARTAPPKVVPFWRRPGLMGAAAGLIVAATAGLAYLRSPQQAPPPLQESPRPAPAAAVAPQAPQSLTRAKSSTAPAKETVRPLPWVEAPATPPPLSVSEPPAAPAAAGAPVPAREDAARMSVQATVHPPAEAQDRMAKKAEAPRSVGGLMEATGSVLPTPAAPKAVAPRQDGANLGRASALPAWTLDLLSDGSTRVAVLVPPGAQAVLLKRSATGVEVTKLSMVDGPKDGAIPWQGKVRLAEGDVLDLYLLNAPVADPARLPETGPVDGYRVRIHPGAKKEDAR